MAKPQKVITFVASVSSVAFGGRIRHTLMKIGCEELPRREWVTISQARAQLWRHITPRRLMISLEPGILALRQLTFAN